MYSFLSSELYALGFSLCKMHWPFCFGRLTTTVMIVGMVGLQSGWLVSFSSAEAAGRWWAGASADKVGCRAQGIPGIAVLLVGRVGL